MHEIRTVKAIDFWIPENVKSRDRELSKGQTSLQRSSARSYQKNAASVQQRISDSIVQFIESKEVNFDFKITRVGGKITVKVIKKATGEVIRQITVKPKITIDMFKGIIYQTIA
jgi:uncharacterized FlaG/YvyC family protein